MSNIVTEIVGSPAEATEAATADAAAVDTTAGTEGAAGAEGTTEAPVEDDKFSARFAALARREKAIREQEETAKGSAEKYKGYGDLAERIKANPLAALEQFGLSIDDVITASLGEDAPEPTVEEQMAQLRAEIAKKETDATTAAEEAKKAEEESVQNNIDEAVAAHQASISEHLSQNAETYQLISLTDNADLVWEVTEANYEKNGTILTPEEAAGQVEAYLTKQVEAANKLSKFNKPQQPLEQAAIEVRSPFEKTPDAPTLTQDLATTAESKSSPNGLSHDESKKRAAALLKWV